MLKMKVLIVISSIICIAKISRLVAIERIGIKINGILKPKKPYKINIRKNILIKLIIN